MKRFGVLFSIVFLIVIAFLLVPAPANASQHDQMCPDFSTAIATDQVSPAPDVQSIGSDRLTVADDTPDVGFCTTDKHLTHNDFSTDSAISNPSTGDGRITNSAINTGRGDGVRKNYA